MIIIPVITFCAGILTEFLAHIVENYYDEHRNRVSERNFSRKDLEGQLHLFCMQWDDRQCIAPIANFRSDLITITNDIRQRVNERSAELNENEKKAIRDVTNDFMKLAGKHQSKTNAVWIQKVEKEMLEVCKRMRKIAAELT